VSFGGNRADRSQNAPAAQHRQEPEPNDGCGEKAAGGEVGVGRRDHLIEAWDAQVKARADSADQEVILKWQLPQHDRRPVFSLLIRLWDLRDDDVTLPHNRDWAP